MANQSLSLYQNFKYQINETPSSLQLVESYVGQKKKVGSVRNWKRALFRKIVDCPAECDDREKGYRLFLAIKILNQMRNTRKASMFLAAMNSLTLEETIFWVWQYHSHGRVAINAFNCIHINPKKGANSGRR